MRDPKYDMPLIPHSIPKKSMKLNQQENAHENVCRYYRS